MDKPGEKDVLSVLDVIDRFVGWSKGTFLQTMLDIDWNSPGTIEARDLRDNTVLVRWDLMGRLIVKRRDDPPHFPSKRDGVLLVQEQRYTIDVLEKLYEGDTLIALLCSAEKEISECLE